MKKTKTYNDALYEVIEEIVAILNFQADIPLDHKRDLSEKLGFLQGMMRNQDNEQHYK